MAPPVSFNVPTTLSDGPAVALLDRPLELPQSLPELATRAMQRFRCLGTACEDTCCRDFGIDIDRASLERMRAAAPTASEREKVVRLVVLGMRPSTGEPARNLVQLDDHGGCPMLDSDGACGVHRQHGESLLSTTCSVFPRTSLAVEGRLEVTGSLACPELARLSLLADDGLEQESPVHPVLPRAYVGKHLDTDTRDLYASAFTRTREKMGELFRSEKFSAGARFAFAATLAAEVNEFFRRDAVAVSTAEMLFLRRRLDVELDAVGSANNLATLNADLASLPDTPPAVAASVAALLNGRLRLTHPPRFGLLVRDALAALGADADRAEQTSTADPLTAFDASVVSARLRARRAAIEAFAPGLMDRLLGRYARHHLLRNPYTERPSLMAYLSRLGMDMATIRFLWLGSSRLEPFFQSSAGFSFEASAEEPVAARATVDAAEIASAARAITDAGIEVIQAYTKAVSHNVEFLNAVHEAEGRPGKIRFGSLILLARFI